MIRKTLQVQTENLISALSNPRRPTLYIVVSLILLASYPIFLIYLSIDFQLIVNILIVPFVLRVRYPKHFSQRYAGVSALCFVCFGIFQMKMFFFFGVGTFILFLVEKTRGRLGELAWLWLILLSPMLQYLVNVFTFPIRLILSEWAGKMMHIMGMQVVVNGNYFEYQGKIFTVDTACMGLNLFITGFMIVSFWIAWFEKQLQKRLPIFICGLSFFLAIVCIFFANLMRIIGLVFFQFPPETIGHEMIGLLCLAFYILLPMYVVLRLAYHYLAIPILDEGFSVWNFGFGQRFKNGKIFFIASLVLLLGTELFFSISYSPKKVVDLAANQLLIPDFEKQVVNDNVLQFTQKEITIYVKPAVSFWMGDHQPTVCWRASGYEFTQIQETMLDNYPIYKAILHKPEGQLYTAWWYDNGKDKTISQMHWRSEEAKGATPYRLINIAATSPELLEKTCKEMLAKTLF